MSSTLTVPVARFVNKGFLLKKGFGAPRQVRNKGDFFFFRAKLGARMKKLSYAASTSSAWV